MTDSKWNPEGRYERPIKDIPEFLARALAVGGADAVAVTHDGLAWLERCGGKPILGRGLVRGPLYLTVPDSHGQPVKVLAIDTDGGVGVDYNHMSSSSPFHREEERLRVNHRLNEIDGIAIDDDYAVRCSWPKVSLDALRPQSTRAAFFRVFDGVAARLARGSAI